MSSFGSISAMITSLKNNKIPKRDHKLGHLEYTKGVPIGKPLRFKNKLSEAERLAYSKKLQRYRQRSDRILIGTCLIVFGILGTFIFYYLG